MKHWPSMDVRGLHVSWIAIDCAWFKPLRLSVVIIKHMEKSLQFASIYSLVLFNILYEHVLLATKHLLFGRCIVDFPSTSPYTMLHN